MDIDTLVQEKIDADTDFLNEIETLDDTEKEEAMKNKRSEILSNEFVSLKERADKADKAEELANNYKIRAEKAEKSKKEVGETTKGKDESLSTTDLYALMTAKVPEEDVEEVMKAAKILGKSVKEALKDDTVSTILKTRQSYRDTAQASNKGASRPSTKKVSTDEILKNASKGIIPEKGSAEAEDLFWAKRGGKR